MTVVAVFYIDDLPVIVGDLLVTGDIKGGADPILMPGTGVFNVDYEYDFEIAGLCQKIVKVSDNLLVGWSGPLSDAVEYFLRLRDEVASLKRVSWRRVRGCLNRAGQHDYDDSLGLVYLYSDTKIVCSGGFGAAKEIQIEGIGKAWACGSGLDTFRRVVGGYNLTMTYPQQRAVSILSRLWSLDTTSQKSFLHRFGGGYELGTRNVDGSVQKIGDILVANAQGMGKDHVAMSGRYLKVDYIDNWLLMRVFEQSFEKDAEGTIGRELKIEKFVRRAYLIPPLLSEMDNPLENERLKELFEDLDAEWTCVHFTASNATQELSTQNCFHRMDRKSPITISSDGSTEWSAELTNWILDEHRGFYS